MGGRRVGVALSVVAVMLLTGCTDQPATRTTSQVTALSAAVTVIPADDPDALGVATSAALFTSSEIALVTGPDGLAEAGERAVELGVPVLPVPADADPLGVGAELARLGATTVVPIGDAALAWAEAAGRPTVDPDDLPDVTAPPAQADLLALTVDPGFAAAATARAAGARVETVANPDPRVAAPPVGDATRIVGLGTGFGSADVLTNRLAVAASGVTLPGGGQVLFPGRRMVALYGHPGVPALGVLGEQGVAESVARAKALAAEYQAVSDQPVVPAFELISTVADAGPGPDGDYSSEASVEFLRPWVDAAREAGVYVLIDLQPGRTDFLTQAQRYGELLAEPHVGLALDPEWRLGPDQVPLGQIGSVGVDEVNSVVTWLADLTRERALPQKLLMIHQFRLTMIVERERLDTSRDELAMMIHADGFGPPGDKLATWTALHAAEPAGIVWGWKNFYDEDQPTFTPAQTVGVGPVPPVFVSYQ